MPADSAPAPALRPNGFPPGKGRSAPFGGSFAASLGAPFDGAERRDGNGLAPDEQIAVVKMLRQKVSERLAERIRANPSVNAERRRAEGERLVSTVVSDYINDLFAAGRPPPPGFESALLDAVSNALFGLGPLQKLLNDPTVVNVHAIGCDRVRVEHTSGRVTSGPTLAESDAELVGMLQMLAMRDCATERSFSAAKPWVDLQTPDGSRITALMQVSQRPIVTVRRHSVMDVSLDELRDRYGLVDYLMCDFLKAAMRAGCNIMVAGLAAAGKTTLLRALAREIPPGEPFVTLEESRELGLHEGVHHPWCISLEAREGHGDRGPDGRKGGEVTIADLIPLTLRLSTRRIIVGEVRSREVVPMLQAMSTSRGSLCTIHARDPHCVLDRVIELALSYGQEMQASLARRMAAGALDLIVYITVEDETAIGGALHRYVSEIVEIGGMSGEEVIMTPIFGPGPDGRGVPRQPPQRLADQLRQVGYDARVLAEHAQYGASGWTRPLSTQLRQASP